MSPRSSVTRLQHLTDQRKGEKEGVEPSVVNNITGFDKIGCRKEQEGCSSDFPNKCLFVRRVRSKALLRNVVSYYLHFIYNFALLSCTGKLIVFRGASWLVPHRQPTITCRPTTVQLDFTCRGRCTRQQDRSVCVRQENRGKVKGWRSRLAIVWRSSKLREDMVVHIMNHPISLPASTL